MKILETQKFIASLAERLDLEYVFLFPSMEDGVHKNQFLIVVNPAKGLTIESMIPAVSLCMAGLEETPYSLLFTGEWLNHIKRGSLYYHYAALPEHRLYQRTRKPHAVFRPKILSSLLELGSENYNRSTKFSDDFLKGAQAYAQKDERSKAAFMLHQFLEIRLKGFQSTGATPAGASHKIERLIKTVALVLPLLGGMIEPESPALPLFRVLDQSYVNVKKKESLELSSQEFAQLFEICTRVASLLDAAVQRIQNKLLAYHNQLEEELLKSRELSNASSRLAAEPVPATNPEENPSDPEPPKIAWTKEYDRDVQGLLDTIRRVHNPEQINLLNYQVDAHHGYSLFGPEVPAARSVSAALYLVIIMKKPGPFTLKYFYQGDVMALGVILSVEELKSKLAKGDRFVHTVWHHGVVLSKKDQFSISPPFVSIDWAIVFEQRFALRAAAKRKMKKLASLAIRCESEDAGTAFSLLRLIVEIGVSAYLGDRIGFFSKHLSLRMLVDCTGIIDDKVREEVFNIAGSNTERLSDLLDTSALWWTNGREESVEDYDVRCKAMQANDFFNALFHSSPIKS